MRVQNFLTGALLSIASLSAVTALPFDNAVEGEQLEERASTIAVTGIQGQGQQVRMELRTMQQQHPDMFNIYLLGLQHMKQVAQTNPLSYYAIAGIHGRPYVPYDGVTSPGGASGYGGGYCTHVSNLFLPWHRPYLLLIEQELYNNVQAAVNTFPAGSAARAKYQAAATNFRMPYWDWAAVPPAGAIPYPTLVSAGYVTVTTPSGQQSILNPLYRYDFNPLVASDFVYNPFASWHVTLRDPTNFNDPGAASQNNLIAPMIANNAASLRDRLFNLFTNYDNFTEFGNEAWINANTVNADSLESVHDLIHSLTGSNGHMTYLDYAAFDPIFWLHHTMVDRIFSMWQQLYPNTTLSRWPLSAAPTLTL